MAENIIRQDVVQISFDIDTKGLKALDGDIGKVAKQLNANVGKDPFNGVTKSTEKASREVTNFAKKLKTAAQTKLDNVKSGLSKISQTMSNITSVAANFVVKLKDIGKIGLDKLKNGLKDVSSKLGDIAKKSAGSAFNGLKKLASISFKALAVGITGAATAIGAIVTKSVQAYADTEQLIGGVETLFGAGGAKSLDEYAQNVGKTASEVSGEYEKLMAAQEKVLENADNAYRTAGMSANQYMDSVTSFSASLISSLGGDTQKAAEYADMAMVDMSDNANKMGSNIDMIVQTYQSLSRGNFAMLDNLKLGYGGTKTEMERLIKDAAKLDSSIKENDMSFGNMVKAIHAVQDKMGITGTTAKEASTTISGSISSMKAAWGNMLSALVSGGDSFDRCVKNLIESIVGIEDETGKRVGGVINNILPALLGALDGVGALIEDLAPIIAEHFPALAEKLIPPLIKATVRLTQGLIQALPTIVKTVITSIVDIFGEQFPALKGIGDKLVDNAGGIAKALVGIFAAVKIAPAIMKIGGLFGGKGGKGGGFSGLVNTFKELAKADIKTVAKGMANLAIIVGSLGALLWIATKAFSGGVDFKEMLKVVALIGVLGLVGAGLSKLAAIIGAIPIMTVVKGLANIAIVMVGLGALLFAATKVFANGVNFQQMLEVIALIGVVGTIGSVLALLAGIIGLIPIPAVALGIANIAIVLVGITAIIEAFGLLSEIPGFTYFLEKGGEVLVKIFNILGQMVGALAGGVLEGISNSLPKVGENLSAFAQALQPMFTAFNGVNMDGVAAFFSAIGAFMLQMAGNNILSFFTGGTDFSGVAEGLNTLASSDGVKNFFNMVNSIEETAFNKGKMLFECLGGISSLPNAGGIAQFFTGDVDYSGVVSGLTTLTSEGVTGFFNMVNAIADEAFNKGKQFFECLDGISSLPNVGGLGQVFSGTNDFQGVANGLAALSNDGVKNFFAMVQGLAPETFDKTKQLFEVLGGLDVDNEGGVFNGIGKFFGGDNTEGIKTIGIALEDFGNKTKAFFEQVNGLNISNLNGLWNSLKNADTVTTHVTSIVDEKINGLVTKIGELPKQMGDALRGSGQALADAFVSIWTEAAKQTARPINKLISGANWILQEFGSDKRVAEWTPYAKGTNGHKGGNALVNDGRGAELVQMPNGRIFIPQGKNVFIPNAPKGMKVLPADKTAQLMGKNSPTFRYAKGIGDIDIFEYYDNAAGLVSRLKESVTYNDVSGIALHLSKGLVKTVTNEMTPWVQKLYDEFFTVQYNASAGVEQWRPIVMKALQMEGLLSPANVNLMLYQMQTESSGNPNCVNNWDINAINGTPSKGLMQVIDPTFRAYARPGFDKNIFDPLSNCLAAIRYTVSRYGSLANGWHGHGYANGGIATKPSIFGEKGAEMAIPLSSNKRNRAVSLWRKTGEMLGVDIPYSDTNGEVSATNSYTVENNTYAPVFNLTISGTNDDRATARKVKKWVREAMDETFESMNRRSPKLRTT